MTSRPKSELAMTFLNLTNANELKVFFDQNNYDVELVDVEKIIEAREFFNDKVSQECLDDYY